MGDTMISFITFIAIVIALILGTIFLAVPLFRALGAVIGGIFTGIGWLLNHVFSFIVGMIRDAVRFLGAIIAFVVLAPFMLLNVVIGRWSASGHFFRSMQRECNVATNCLYRIALQRPLRFLLLGGLLEGVEERFGEAVAATPPADKPSRHTGKFDGYTIVGSLPVGGSGAKLYIAEPNKQLREQRPNMPGRVVIKAFALTDGSSLPQIVRESRALEAAKQLGLVLDHNMDEHRFFYVMPYHDGDHLSIVARQLHGESDGNGLGKRELVKATGYVEDLLLTLREYHNAGLWHKDVKPDNIIIHDGRAHLVDLGLVTPLRSAMTLTTHGTEYFRDPEMVRQALRGVKVHQVDGTKFDIYAVGAVMYFLLESEFPAHGGLSRFVRKSPEALRWIVRRAMTDYNKRYASVDLMLADIRHVMGAGDPANVKPAELPSMRENPERVAEAVAAAAAQEADERANAKVEASAGSPQPKREDDNVRVAGFAAGIGKKGPFMQVGKLHLDENGEPVWNEGNPGTRPRLRVTSWWTGAYVPDGPLPETAAQPAGVHVAHAAAPARSPGHAPFVANRSLRAAKAQVAAAQARAATISKRAAKRRATMAPTSVKKRHVNEQAGPVAAMRMIIVLACIIGGLYIVRGVVNDGAGDHGSDFMTQNAAEASVLAAGFDDIEAPWPLLVVNDHPAKTNPVVSDRIQRYMDDREDGWEFVADDLEAEARVRSLLPTGELANFTELPAGPLNELLRELNVLGVLQFSAGQGEAAPQDRLRAVFIMCPEGDYDKPLIVRAQTIPVIGEIDPAAPPEPPTAPNATVRSSG